MTATLAKILSTDLGVKETYQHGPKTVLPGASIETDGAVLKWYRLYPEDQPVPEEIDRLARSFLDRTPLEAKGLGFVILHRCGSDFYFLIVTTWRGNNELWETVYYKDGERMTDFELWPRNAAHKPAYCAWELAAVWHEKEAWERFLKSPRDQTAAETWHHDLYAGPA
jgi:hypothetical protein